MADITKGKTFTVNESITNVKLHQFVDSGTVADVTRGDFTGSTAIFVGSSAPSTSLVDNELWFDTTNKLLRRYDSADSQWHPLMGGVILTNKHGSEVNAGDVVVWDTANDDSFTSTTTGNQQNRIGVVAETIAADAKGLVRNFGIMDVQSSETVAIGETLQTSTTALKALGALASSGGQVMGMWLEATVGAGLAKAMLWP